MDADVAVVGYGFSEPWMVCDFRLKREVDLPGATQWCDPRQPTSVISLGPAHHRFSFMLDSPDDFDTESDPALVWRRVARFISPDEADMVRVATYTFRSLVADSWREGRILLAGDAAHEMPPFLGQGMCSGIRDAQNAAFKLDLVLRGARPDLLGTYQAEREPHVRAVIEKGIELGRVQTMRDPVAAAERDRALLAQRAARQAPAKLRFPGLRGGMLASAPTSGRGELFIQAIVDDGRRRGLFDEVIGAGFALLTAAPLDDARLRAALRHAGVRVVTLAGPDAVLDVSGAYHRWLEQHGCCAVAVRPDFYVYGCAVRESEVRALASELLADLGQEGHAGTVALPLSTPIS